VTVDSVEVFRHFAFWRHKTRLAGFLIVPQKCIFEAHLLSELKPWQLWSPKSYKAFMKPIGVTMVYFPNIERVERIYSKNIVTIYSRV